MKRKLCSHAFFMISALFVTTRGMAQVPGEPTNIQSPTTASLGLYGEMPVSHFTGVPDISIPLYTFSEKRLSVPLSLKYHASGFRPDQHPGWVGAGWSLHAGGVISRTLKDMHNDLYSLVDPGFWFNYSILNASNWDQVVYMRTVAEDDDMLKILSQMNFHSVFRAEAVRSIWIIRAHGK